MGQGKFVAYYRVSIRRQGASGLGLEAQQNAVRGYLNGGRWQLVEEIVDIESGKWGDRPSARSCARPVPRVESDTHHCQAGQAGS